MFSRSSALPAITAGHMLLFASALLSASLLSGCVTTPSSFANLGHYDQYRLNTDIFRVTFHTDQRRYVDRADEITLLKAAQVTLDNGYRYFEVTDKTPSFNNGIAGGTPAFGYYGYAGRPYRSIGYVGYNDPVYYPTYYSSPEATVSYTIHCTNTANPTDGHQYDAQTILRELGPRYGLNADGTAVVPVTPTPATSKPMP